MKKLLVKYPVELLVGLCLLLFFTTRPVDTQWNRVIFSDGLGYYAHLPAVFIYQDLEFEFYHDIKAKYLEQTERQQHTFVNYFKEETVNKYFSGAALLWLPFFLLAHLLSWLFGFEPDGYSLLYQYGIGLAGVFYLWLGSKAVYRMLQRFSDNPWHIAAALTLTILGTNLFFYAVYSGSMTHVYSFALIAWFLELAFRFNDSHNKRWLYGAALCFGLIVITRPSNGIVLFTLPFIAGSWANLKQLFATTFQRVHYWTVGLGIIGLLLFMQSLLWYLESGHWYVYTYAEEGFDFARLKWLQSLFSYRKGWFVYTPLALVAIIGLEVAFRKNKFQGWALAGFLLFMVYIISSWQVWWYGGGFGLRAYVDFYALIAVLLLFTIQWISVHGKARIVFGIGVTGMLLLNLVQTYQYQIYILPYDDINKEIYWSNFLRLQRRAQVRLDHKDVVSIKQVENDLETEMEGWGNKHTFSTEKAHSGVRSSKMQRKSPYGVIYKTRIGSNITTANGKIAVASNVWTDQEESKIVLTMSLVSEGIAYHKRSFSLSEFTIQGGWTPVEFAMDLKKLRSPEDSLVTYYWIANEKEKAFVDDVRVSFISMKEEEF